MNKQILILIVVGFGLIIGMNSFYVVNEGQQTITTQFGDPVGEKVVEAGLYFKIPFIQKVHFFDRRILKWDGQPNEIPTKDKKYIWVDVTARWKVADPLLFLQRMGNMNRAYLRLSDLINGSVRDFVTKNVLAEVVQSSDWDPSYSSSSEKGTDEVRLKIKVGRDKFSELVLIEVAKTAEGYGIELLDVLVKRVNYTNQVREKVYSRMISERQRIATQRRSEGEAIKAEVLGAMEKDLSRITSQAYKESVMIKGEADAKVTRLYGQSYGKDPEFYKFLMSLESYKTVLGANTRLVIDSSSPLYKYLQGKK